MVSKDLCHEIKPNTFFTPKSQPENFGFTLSKDGSHIVITSDPANIPPRSKQKIGGQCGIYNTDSGKTQKTSESILYL